MRARVADDLKTEFDRTGYVAIPGLFDSAATERIRGWIDEMQSWPETPGRHMMYFEDSKADPPARLLNRIENFYPYHTELRDLLDGDEMQGAASRLFGEPAVLFKEKVNFKMPGGGGFDPHQDAQAGWDDYASLCLTAMVSIDEADLDNGCLEMAQWSHRRDLIGRMWEPLTSDELSAADVSFVAIPTAPGDAVFFDSYIPHQSAPNPTDRQRRVLYVTYNRLSEGDHRVQYYADKRKSYPPDCEREPGKSYAYRV